MANIFTIAIDDVLTLNEDEGFYLDAPIVGLDIPDIRTSAIDYSGRDGGEVTAQFFGVRNISIPGRIHASTSAELDARRKELQRAVQDKSFVLTVKTYGGGLYQTAVNLISFSCDIVQNMNSATFKMEVRASDPLLYDVSTGAGLSVDISKEVGGGYTTPYILPVVWDAGSSPVNAENTGGIIVYPKITVSGSATNPKFINNTTGKFFQVNAVMSGSDELYIDMAEGIVLLNGSNLADSVVSGSEFWGLETGENLISLETDVALDDLSGVVEWQPGFLGV